MKKKHFYAGLAAGASALAATSALAQSITAYTPGDVVVYRVGDGTAALSNAGTAVFLDEYNPLTGTLDGTQALSTGANPVVASGTATSEGLLTLSDNGQFLLATGYAAPVGTLNGTTSITGTSSTTVPRAVETISGAGALVQTTINNYTANNIRGASSADGVSIYTSGANTGILNVTSGAVNTTGTLIASTVTNTRNIAVSGGNLFVSTASGSALRIGQVGTGLPTTTGQTITEVPGIPASATVGTAVNAPYQFKAVTLTLGGTTTDTIYVADNGSGLLEKFSGSLTNGFTLTGTATLAGISGLAAMAVPGVGERLVASTAAGLFLLTDTSGAGGTLTAAFGTAFATPATNEAFRGDAFAPAVTTVPEPSTWATILLGAFGLGAVLRFRSKSARA